MTLQESEFPALQSVQSTCRPDSSEDGLLLDLYLLGLGDS